MDTNNNITILISSQRNDSINLNLILENTTVIIKYSKNETKNQTFSYSLQKKNMVIHGFIDHSILELFINYEFSISKRIYNFGENLKVNIQSSKNAEIKVFQLNPISLN